LKKWAAVSAVIVLVALSSLAGARDWVPFVETPGSTEAVARVASTDARSTLIEIDVPGMYVERTGGVADITIPGAAKMQTEGQPDLPVLSYFVAIPDRGGVELEIVSASERILTGYDVAAAAPFAVQGREPAEAVRDSRVYGSDAFFPNAIAEMGEPAIMRDLRLVQVRVYPVRVNPVTGMLVAFDRVQVRLNYTDEEGVNEKAVVRPYRSEAFEPLYESIVLNYEQLPRTAVQRGTYLIIAHDSFLPGLIDLTEWRDQSGYQTEVVPLSMIGANPSNQEIKDYIQAYYETNDPAPDYVLLVGDTWGAWGFFPSWHVNNEIGTPCVGDHRYEELEGDDYLPDVLIGRFSIDTVTEAIVASLKVLSYERDCDAGNDEWYEKALMVAGNTGGTHVTSPRQTTLRVREMMLDYGYAQVDTIYYPPVTSPVPIDAAINAGVGFVNYRGWAAAQGWHYPEFYVDNINALSNGKMLPVMTSVVCGTGDFDSWGFDPAFCEAWIRSGSPGELRGGPAIIAASDVTTHTKWNNAMDIGIYDGIFKEGLTTVGQAHVRGKLEILRNFPLYAEPEEQFGVRYYFDIYSVVGEPGLRLRTKAPGGFTVSHDATVPLGKNVITVGVEDAARGGVVPGAEVVVLKEGESYEVRRLEGGQTIQVPINAMTPGEVSVTVLADNYKPYVGTFNVVADDVFLGWYSHIFDDDNSGGSSGNGDGVPNPGETIEVTVELKNYGVLPATGVECRLDHPTTGQLVSYGDIPAGLTDSGDGPFVVDIPLGAPDGTEIIHNLYANDGGNDVYLSQLRFVVGAPLLSYFTFVVDDGGDGVLDPGESATLEVALTNGGALDATSVTGTLMGPGAGLTISDDQGGWGTVPAAGMQSNSGNTFSVAAASDVAVGHDFTMILNLAGDGGLSQSVLFDLEVGTPASTSPLDPDAYGYYAYDDTDTDYPEAPAYSWIEIDPSYGGSGTDLGLVYESVVDVALPFTFRYYGQDFNTIAICSNGNVGLGGAPYWEHQPRNTTIPCGLGPDAMIAPFWDDLNPGTGGKVLTEDLGDGRYVVEWSRVVAQYDSTDTTLQTFEMVLYDQNVYPTTTGDGEILFQYYEICDCDSFQINETHNYSTVGIENPTQTDGVLYAFSGLYPVEAAELAAGRAVKFTTDPPDGYPSSDIPEGEVPFGIVLKQNRPNPFNPVTTIAFGMPMGGRAELSIYDITGRVVTTLVDGEVGPGFHNVTWDGTNSSGEKVASGVYFSRLSALGEDHARKMILLK
jgi:hypothetical protein